MVTALITVGALVAVAIGLIALCAVYVGSEEREWERKEREETGLDPDELDRELRVMRARLHR